MMRFESVSELGRWLEEQGVDTSCWGAGAAKRVVDLFAEIGKGESIMQNEPPLRAVVAVRVVVRRNEHILIEAAQGFNSGRSRKRGGPPSEKMYPGEHYADAAARCLHEELDVASERIRLLPATYRQKSWVGDPASYPGLLTHYTFHIVDAQVRGLPPHGFETRERATGPGEPVHVHFWEWRRPGDKA